jgi:phage FluMu protein Com
MNWIPNFFRKSKTQTGEAINSPTKDILTPAELDKLKNKVKAELAKAEARIAYIAGRRHRPKEGDSKEITKNQENTNSKKQLQAEISNQETKYKEIVDPNWVIYKQKKPPTPSTLENDNFALLNTVPIKKNLVSELFDYTGDQAQAHDQAQAQALDQAQAAPPRNVEELASQCANCKATVSHSAYASVGQCSKCKVVTQLTTPVERTDTLEEDTESWRPIWLLQPYIPAHLFDEEMALNTTNSECLANSGGKTSPNFRKWTQSWWDRG